MFQVLVAASSGSKLGSFQIVNDQEAEKEEHDRTSPEYPLVLFGSSLYHSDSVTRYTKSVGDAIKFALGVFHNVSLIR